MEKVLAACAKHGVVMECNSYPDRLDLKDVYLRMCKERGVKVVISTDSHNAGNLKLIRYGVRMARRGWLEKKDVINTLGVGEFLGNCGGGGGKRRVAEWEWRAREDEGGWEKGGEFTVHNSSR